MTLRIVSLAAAATVAAASLLPVQPARAWWAGGVVVGVPAPVVPVPPPVYYPAPYPYPYPYPYPPAAYAPPPPPAPQSPVPDQRQQNAQIAYGTTCYAGVYVCAAPGGTPVGSGCSCPGLGAPSYGVVQ